MLSRPPALGIALVATWLVAAACDVTPVAGSVEGRGAAAAVHAPAPTDLAPVDLDGVHNVVAFGPGLYSGSAPEGDNAFETLAAMGVKTIVSVDGAVPQVDRAAAEGIRYVHLPITYSGISRDRALEIARAVRDLPGPVYVHCHHGKHRSAAAAGVAAVALGVLEPEQAVARMKVSGTAPGYTGLYACVADACVESDEALDRASDVFPPVSRPHGITEAMVHIDEIHENLTAIEKAGWITPANHPDLVPVAEAARLVDFFRNLRDDDGFADKPDDFREMMHEAVKSAHEIEDLLTEGGAEPAVLSARFKALNADCKRCHVKYRD